MPIETFDFINSLVPTNPIHTDALSEADSHLRGIKQTLTTTFPNVAGAVSATDVQLSAAGVAFDTPGTVEIAANGTTLGGVLRLDGITAGNDVAIYNTGTAGGPPGLAIHLNQGTTVALPAFTVSPTGTIGAYAAMNAPSVQKAGNELLPTGVILMWSGSLASIPAGYILCDGTSGTPDLRNTFILGAGSTGYSAPGATGGAFTASAATSTGGSHSHGGVTAASGAFSGTWQTDAQGGHAHGGSTEGHALLSNEMPPHQHQVPGMTGSAGDQAGAGFAGLGPAVTNSGAGMSFAAQSTSLTDAVGAGWVHTHLIDADGLHQHNASISVGNHQHGISLDGSHSHTVSLATIPPYFALAFIMKT